MREGRLFQIVYYILEHGQATAPELAKKFEVSVRTIYRDMDAISSAGIPIYAAAGRNGGIRILENYVLDRALFSEKEKKEILSALQSVCLVNSLYEKQALSKLSALWGIRSDSWFEVDFSRWGHRTRDQISFEQLKNAIISRNAVSIIYVNSNGERSKRNIYPLKMMLKAKEWYLKAYCTDKSDFRTFKFNRILSSEVLPEVFSPMEYPKPRDLPRQAYRTISLCFPKEMAYRVYDEFDAHEIQESKTGELYVSAEMPEDSWLVSYLLSFGTQVKVLEPAYLRTMLSNQAKQIYEMNKP